MMTTGQALLLERTRLGLHQHAIAAKLGISQTTYSSYERDKGHPDNAKAVLAMLLQARTATDIRHATIAKSGTRPGGGAKGKPVAKPDEYRYLTPAEEEAAWEEIVEGIPHD